MEFPYDILVIIKEYSQPITRSDWKSKPKMTLCSFFNALTLYLKKHPSPPMWKHVIMYGIYLKMYKMRAGIIMD
jgi:hypothetical protein